MHWSALKESLKEVKDLTYWEKWSEGKSRGEFLKNQCMPNRRNPVRLAKFEKNCRSILPSRKKVVF